MTLELDCLESNHLGCKGSIWLSGVSCSELNLSNWPEPLRSISPLREFVNLEIFATAAPLISPSGFSSLAAGNHPITATVPYAALADVIGDLEFNVPDLVVPEQDVVLTGLFRVLGDTDLDGFVEYEVELATGLLLVQSAQIGGEPVQISVSTQLTTHFSGRVAQALPVPVLGFAGMALLASGILLSAGLALRRV